MNYSPIKFTTSQRGVHTCPLYSEEIPDNYGMSRCVTGEPDMSDVSPVSLTLKYISL